MVHRSMHVGVVLAAVLAIPCPASSEELEASHRQEIETLMDLTGARNLGKQMGKLMVEQLYAALRQANPSLPDQALRIVEEVTLELIDERSGELVDRAVPLYAKYFSEKEISELVAFYQTPTGRKVVRVLPSLMQELMPLSQEWARSPRP